MIFSINYAGKFMICVHFTWLFGLGGKPFACIASEAMPKNALCQMFSKLLCVFHVAKLHAFDS